MPSQASEKRKSPNKGPKRRKRGALASVSTTMLTINAIYSSIYLALAEHFAALIRSISVRQTEPAPTWTAIERPRRDMPGPLQPQESKCELWLLWNVSTLMETLKLSASMWEAPSEILYRKDSLTLPLRPASLAASTV